MKHPICRKWFLVFLCLYLLAVIPAAAQETSTPQERAQWVQVTRSLESTPLNEAVSQQGDAALHRVMAVHDLHVPLCAGLFNEFKDMKYAYAHAILRQYMLGSAAFMIENPDKSIDTNAMNRAAVESVLKAYKAILQQQPDAKAKVLDDLLKKQSQGKLGDTILRQCR